MSHYRPLASCAAPRRRRVNDTTSLLIKMRGHPLTSVTASHQLLTAARTKCTASQLVVARDAHGAVCILPMSL